MNDTAGSQDENLMAKQKILIQWIVGDTAILIVFTGLPILILGADGYIDALPFSFLPVVFAWMIFGSIFIIKLQKFRKV
jgi:hypothetical protein